MIPIFDNLWMSGFRSMKQICTRLQVRDTKSTFDLRIYYGVIDVNAMEAKTYLYPVMLQIWPLYTAILILRWDSVLNKKNLSNVDHVFIPKSNNNPINSVTSLRECRGNLLLWVIVQRWWNERAIQDAYRPSRSSHRSMLCRCSVNNRILRHCSLASAWDVFQFGGVFDKCWRTTSVSDRRINRIFIPFNYSFLHWSLRTVHYFPP